MTALLLRERQSRDRAQWAEMADCYAADATIAMSWFDGSAADFIERSRSMDLLGDDRPDGVSQQLAANLRWLHEDSVIHH